MILKHNDNIYKDIRKRFLKTQPRNFEQPQIFEVFMDDKVGEMVILVGSDKKCLRNIKQGFYTDIKYKYIINRVFVVAGDLVNNTDKYNLINPAHNYVTDGEWMLLDRDSVIVRLHTLMLAGTVKTGILENKETFNKEFVGDNIEILSEDIFNNLREYIKVQRGI